MDEHRMEQQRFVFTGGQANRSNTSAGRNRRRQQSQNPSSGANGELVRQQMAEQFRQHLLSEFNQAWNQIGRQQFRNTNYEGHPPPRNNNTTTNNTSSSPDQPTQNIHQLIEQSQQQHQYQNIVRLQVPQYSRRGITDPPRYPLPPEQTDIPTPRYPNLPYEQPQQQTNVTQAQANPNPWTLDPGQQYLNFIQLQQQQYQQQLDSGAQSTQFAYNQLSRRGGDQVPTVGPNAYNQHSLQYSSRSGTLVRGPLYNSNNSNSMEPCPNLSEEDVYQLIGIERQQQAQTGAPRGRSQEVGVEMDGGEDLQEMEEGGIGINERSWWQQQPVDQQDAEFTVFESIPECSFLSKGVAFSGQQMVRNARLSPSQEDTEKQQNRWGVTVVIQGVDMKTGSICGMMQASNVPGATKPILTFWTGEIIDNVNNTLLTNNWGARPMDDEHFWSHFCSYSSISENCVAGRCPQLPTHSHIYMRWKEQFFINDCPNSRLTISGFYYVAMNRQTGDIQGWYFDKNMGNSYQELLLHRVSGNEADSLQQGGAVSGAVRIVTNEQQRQKNARGQSFPSYKLY